MEVKFFDKKQKELHLRALYYLEERIMDFNFWEDVIFPIFLFYIELKALNCICNMYVKPLNSREKEEDQLGSLRPQDKVVVNFFDFFFFTQMSQTWS